MSRCYLCVGAVKDDLPGHTFDYFFGSVGNTASHSFPVHESLTLDPGAFHYRGDELDPLPIGEGFEVVVELLLSLIHI